MTWFRVDDGFYSHPKVIRIPRSLRAEALGTWTLCGTWSTDKLQDGFVPEYMIEELGGTLAGAEALVAAGLWKRRARRAGFEFVHWEEFQFTREQVLEKRTAESRRKAEYRARKARQSEDVSEDVPSGHKRDPHHPSRPVPIDDVPTVNGHPHVSGGDERTDLSPAVQSVVENVAAFCRREIHPLFAVDVIEFIEGRRGPRARPLMNPPRYYASAIASSAAEVQQFIDEKGLAS